MKKLILTVLVLFFSFSVLADNEEYIETQFTKRQRVNQKAVSVEGRCGLDPSIPFIVGSYATNPPFSWVDVKRKEDGGKSYALRGYNIDFMKKMAKDLKIRMQSKAYKTDADAFRALQIGEISAFIGMYYDPKFKKAGYTYVNPSYFQNIIGTVVLKEKNLDLKTLDDLKNLKGVVRVDERFYDYIRLSIPEGVHIQQVPDSRTAFLKLLKGEADYILTSPYTAEAEARRYKMHKDIKMQTLPFPEQAYFIVFSPVSPCRALNKTISNYLNKKNNDKNARVQALIDYIDDWGQRFRNDKGLAQELAEKQETSEEKDKTEATDATGNGVVIAQPLTEDNKEPIKTTETSATTQTPQEAQEK